MRAFTYTVIAALLISQALSQNVPRLRLQGTSGFIQLPEDTEKGYIMGTLIATDIDPGDTLTIEMVDTTTKELVSLSTATGNSTTGVLKNISLVAKLNVDDESNTRQLHFKVTDSTNNMVPLSVTLYISDVNDVAPAFVNLPYRAEVYENESIGASVYSVSAKDPDTGLGGVVTIWLEDPFNIGNPFEIRGSDVFLNQRLNYSVNTFYQLKVHARDGAPPFNNATPADLIVNVLDVQNSPPFFTNQPYTRSIPENTPTASSVLTVSAYDGDRGVPNQIQYTLLEDGDGAHNFTINGTTGQISVEGGLDADTEEAKQNGGLVTLTVNASEIIEDGQINTGRTWTTAEVFITVTDVNDNIPTFMKPLYTAFIAENSPKGIPLTMQNGELIEVFDLDQVLNNKFVIYLDENNPLSVAFDTIPAQNTTDIHGQATIILKVNDPSFLDYEERTNITFKIKARENLNISETTIVVQIEDVNDNSPIFDTNQQTAFMVKEGSDLGTFIGEMKATDKETGVTFSLDGDDDGVFDIGSLSGNITVNGTLDRETRSSYTLFVIATDSPPEQSQQRATSIRISIGLIDINDNKPEFVNLPSRVDISEESKIGTELLTVQAIDKDNGTNKEIWYSLGDNGNITGFVIGSESGTISVNGSLIGMVGARYITVVATDKGEPPLNSSRSINLYVKDVNLEKPVFYQPSQASYNLSASLIPMVEVKEEEVPGSLIYTIFANDSDSGQNGAILYSILPDNSEDWQKFRVDRQNGNLTNIGRLDRETQETYTIMIVAEDQGFPSLDTTITMVIKLLDINDNEPVFENDRNKPHVLEVFEEKADIVVGNVSLATDKDAEPIVFYSIKGGELLDHFKLNSTSGLLSLIKPLDRETISLVHLVIQANSYDVTASVATGSTKADFINSYPSEYDPDNKTLLWVRVDVKDINDQPPVFSQPKISAAFLYDVQYGTVVKELREEVTDADIGENAITYFRLIGPIISNGMVIGDAAPMSLDKNGSIKTSMTFSADMAGAFVLNVEAYDIGNLTNKAEVELYLISDIQRLKLVFGRTPDEVRAIKNELIEALEKNLNFRIVVDKIATHQLTDGSPVVTKSDMFIHARYLDTDKVVPAEELWRALDFSESISLILQKYGVQEASPIIQVQKTDDVEEDLKKSLIIITSGLALIVLILVLVLMNIRSRYRRKLRAASTKTFGSAKDTIPDLIPPGTNKYYAAASNPVYMKEGMTIDLTEDSTSRNSLDDNEVDDKLKAAMSLDPEVQEIALTMYDEQPETAPDGNHSSTLDLVLQQYQELHRVRSEQGDNLSLDEFSDIKNLEQTDI